MSNHLIVVESPAKAKTMSKYLGKDFTCLASYGHVRDLIPKQGAVETDNGFGMKYQLIEKNKKHVDAIVKAMKKADSLYLATDPDREGEAISWHLYEILRAEEAIDDKPVHRVEFHEITKSAIQHAIESPRQLSENLINAQQARRALDYLVGFNLSPLLWKKVRRGLSAGRVQSPALRLIVEREEEIEKFIAREYWTIQRRQWRARRGNRRRPESRGAGQVASAVGREETAPAQSGAAVHYFHPAAGGLAQARIQRPAHHAHGATALRRRRSRSR